MILVDTSVWIDHLRFDDVGLTGLLDAGAVLAHPFVIGELACGNLTRRSEFLSLLDALPRATMGSDPEVLIFIDGRRLMGLGIGYVDAHLLAAVALTPAARLWTRDARLAAIAQRLNLGFQG